MQITNYGKNILILNLMFPLKSPNVPLGVHVLQFGNPWTSRNNQHELLNGGQVVRSVTVMVTLIEIILIQIF